VPEAGRVVSVSGTYECEAGSTCTVEVVDILFDETFEVVVEEGYTFEGWAAGGLCGSLTAPCHLWTTFFGDNETLTAFLESDDVFSLEPVIGTSSTAGTLCNYTDTTFNNQDSLTYTSTSQWICTDTSRELSANGIPDHEVGTFPNANNPNTIYEQLVSASYTLEPAATGSATALGGPRGATGYVLNGVKIDASTAGTCDDSGASCSLAGNVGNWNIEALGHNAFNFGTDDNNAHVQPGGVYHYHGMPEGFIAKQGGNSSAMTLIGWAADGFPIYARHGHSVADDASSELKVITGSYQYISEVSGSRPSVDLYPLGTFAQDWEYVEGSGDLDECNGRIGVTPEFPGGIYHYYATDTYPYFQRCVKGAVEVTDVPGGGPPPLS
jgi:hypothetical protein